MLLLVDVGATGDGRARVTAQEKERDLLDGTGQKGFGRPDRPGTMVLRNGRYPSVSVATSTIGLGFPIHHQSQSTICSSKAVRPYPHPTAGRSTDQATRDGIRRDVGLACCCLRLVRRAAATKRARMRLKGRSLPLWPKRPETVYLYFQLNIQSCPTIPSVVPEKRLHFDLGASHRMQAKPIHFLLSPPYSLLISPPSMLEAIARSSPTPRAREPMERQHCP